MVMKVQMCYHGTAAKTNNAHLEKGNQFKCSQSILVDNNMTVYIQIKTIHVSFS